MTPQEQELLNFFFTPPLPMQTGILQSILHLVRREMQDCLIGTVVAEDAIVAYPGDRHRLFATVMVIMAGIDLLAKFYAGNDAKRDVYVRFKAFVKEFVFAGYPSADDYADVLYYGCRNPLLHSFTLHQPLHQMKKYRISLVDKLSAGPVWRVKGHPDHFVISVEGLAQAFVKAVRDYEAAVRAKTDLLANFTALFPDYGSMDVRANVVDKVTP